MIPRCITVAVIAVPLALVSCGDKPEGPDALISQLIAELDDKDASISAEAAYKLGRIGSQAVPELRSVLLSDRQFALQRAADALAAIATQEKAGIGNPSPALDALIEALQSDDNKRSDFAANALSRIVVRKNDKMVNAVIARWRTDSRKHANGRAVLSLGPLALRPIMKLLREDASFDKARALKLIGRMEPGHLEIEPALSTN